MLKTTVATAKKLLAELRRRSVLQTAVVYLVSAWLVVQVCDILLPVFDAPAWSMRALIAALAIGFIPAMVLSWVYQWTPRGFKRDPADSERAGRMLQRRRSDQASAASPQSIAVLPLKTLGASEETQRFAERLHDDLLNRLSQVRALKVISRTSLFEYRDGNKTLPEIGRELGVATVLEGSLQQVRSRLRLNAQLIDVRADANVWADSFDLPADDDALFDLQVEVALAIAEALKAQLLPQDTEALGRRLSADPQALSAWREAQDFVNRANAGDFDRAAALLDTAQARDPSFAAVHSLRARNAIARFWFSEPDERLRRESLTELEKARVLDPDAPELLVAEGYYYYWGFADYAGALKATDAALVKLPNDPDVLRLRGFIQRRRGEWAAASDDLARALEFDPRSAFGHAELAMTLLRLRKFDAADAHAEQALALDRSWGFARMVKALILIERDGALRAALDLLEAGNPGGTQPAYLRWWLKVAMADFTGAMACADFAEHVEDRVECWPPALVRGLTAHYAGRADEAHVLLQAAVMSLLARRARQPDYEPAVTALCLAYGALGQGAQALAAAAQAQRVTAADAVARGHSGYQLACGLALAGEHEQALQQLIAQLRAPHVNGRHAIDHEPAFAALRRTREFRAWRRKLGQDDPAGHARPRLPRVAVYGGVATLALAASALLWWRTFAPEHLPAPAAQTASTATSAAAPVAAVQSPRPALQWPAPFGAPTALEQRPRVVVAVLPFAADSEDDGAELFASGLTNELRSALERIDGLAVAGVASSEQLSERRDDLAAAAKALGAGSVLEGRVALRDDRTVIEARLLRALDAQPLWSQRWESAGDDLLDVQLDIAQRVADSLDVVLHPQQLARMQQLGLRNVEAFIAFQQGRALYAAAHDPARSSNLIATLREANIKFARVIELEPEFSPAYYLSTDLYNHIMMSDDSGFAEREHAINQANRDLRLGARFAFDDEQRLLIDVDRQLASNDWRGLGALMGQAVVRQGYRQSNWLPIAAAFGFANERLAASMPTIERDPLSALGWFNAARAANWADQPQQALALQAQATERIGGSPNISLQALRASVRLGQLDLAQALLAGLDPASANSAIGQLLLAHARGEDVAAAAARLKRVRTPGFNPEVWSVVDLLAGRLTGDLAANDRMAATADAQPGGPLKLATWVFLCQCGAPFDLAATPNFGQRLSEAELPWPPADLLLPVPANVAP